MNNIRTLAEAFLLQYVTPSERDAARADLLALVNAAEMGARRDEIVRRDIKPREARR